MASALLSEVGRGEVRTRTTIVCVPLSPEEVGRRIVRAREEMAPKAWSQFDLALALSVSPSTIYRWEKGKLPSMNELLRLAEVLHKPVDYLTEPPERQVALSDLQALLESLEVTVSRTGAATTSALEDLTARIQRVEKTLELRDRRASGE